MKRLQLMIDDELDEALARVATAERTSKSELVRRYVREGVEPLPAIDDDPLMKTAGVDDFEPAAVDEVVYP